MRRLVLAVAMCFGPVAFSAGVDDLILVDLAMDEVSHVQLRTLRGEIRGLLSDSRWLDPDRSHDVGRDVARLVDQVEAVKNLSRLVTGPWREFRDLTRDVRHDLEKDPYGSLLKIEYAVAAVAAEPKVPTPTLTFYEFDRLAKFRIETERLLRQCAVPTRDAAVEFATWFIGLNVVQVGVAQPEVSARIGQIRGNLADVLVRRDPAEMLAGAARVKFALDDLAREHVSCVTDLADVRTPAAP